MSEVKPAPTPILISSMQMVKSPDFKDLYSNSPRVSMTPFDMTLMFGKIIEPSPGVNVIEDLAHVRLSPYQFKAFVQSMVVALDAWEETFGTINSIIPPMMKESVSAGMESLKKAILAQTIPASATGPKPRT